MTITEQAADPVSLAAQALDPDGADTVPSAVGAPVPDDPDAIAMYTAHRLDDTFRHLSHASERLQAARDASGDLRQYHTGHVAFHLHQALGAGQKIAANLRAHYPAEGEELDKTAETIGLAKAVTEAAKQATTAHLLQTILYDEGHASRHADAMLDPASDEEWSFNADHAEKHIGGAVEHAGKFAEQLRDNYPAEAKWLDGLQEVADQEAEPDTISGQAAKHAAVS